MHLLLYMFVSIHFSMDARHVANSIFKCLLDPVERIKIKDSSELFRTQKLYPSCTYNDNTCILVMTVKGFVWKEIRNTLPDAGDRTGQLFYECVMTHEDFTHEYELHDKILKVFGQDILEHCFLTIPTDRDLFTTISDDLVIKLASQYLDMKSILMLSQTCIHFKKLCNSDALWKQVYMSNKCKPRYSDIYKNSIEQVGGWKEWSFLTEPERILQKNIECYNPLPLKPTQRKNKLPKIRKQRMISQMSHRSIMKSSQKKVMKNENCRLHYKKSVKIHSHVNDVSI